VVTRSVADADEGNGIGQVRHDFPVPRRPKNINDVAKSPGNATNSAKRRLGLSIANAALRRLGYASDEQMGHGFRSMASALPNEQGFPPDVIELQLAHSERNKVRAAYDRAQRPSERKKTMQTWVGYLDGIKAGEGGKVPMCRAQPAA
jgi:integrase